MSTRRTSDDIRKDVLWFIDELKWRGYSDEEVEQAKDFFVDFWDK